MTSISAIIVEDIPANREALKKMLQSECPEVDILGEAETVEEAEVVIKETQPQLVFLDIEIKRATSFDLLAKLHQENVINFEIIFFTAHGTYEYATRAIEYSALDFLTKPIDPQKLCTAVRKASLKLNQQQHHQQIELLLETLSRPNFKSRRIAFHLIKGIIEFVDVDQIIYLEADGTMTDVYLASNRKLTAMRNIGHYSNLLMADYPFFPISNSLLVNENYIQQYKHKELSMKLTNGKVLFASRRGGQNFRRYLNEGKGKFANIQDKGILNLLKRFFKS